MKYKQIFNVWNSFLKESEAFGENPADFDNTIFSRKFTEKKLDKTSLSEEEVIKDLSEYLLKYDNVYISFIDKYDEISPRLSVNPKITYNTPHGLYAYPLTKNKFYQFLLTGNPTSADFATDMPYFHVFLLKDTGKIKIEKDYSTNYNDKNYVKDFKTIVKLGMDYFTSLFDNNEELRSLFISDTPLDNSELSSHHLKEINSINSGSMYSIIGLFADMSLNNQYVNIDSPLFIDLCRYIESFMYVRLDDKRREQVEKSKFHMLFSLAHTFVRMISFIKNTVRTYHKDKNLTSGLIATGGLYTLLISAININSIDDSLGTATIHEAEPSQAVTVDINNSDNVILLGTYKNKIYESIKRIETGEISENDRDDYITSLIEKGIIDSRLINFKNYDW